MARFTSRRSAILRLSFFAMVIASAFFAVAANATSARPIRVELSAPTACPTKPALLDRVRAHTSQVREAAPNEKAELLRLKIVPARGGFVANVRMTGDDALDRRVSGRTCEEVLAAVALIVALNVDAAAGQAAAPEPRPEAGAPERSSAAPPRRRATQTKSSLQASTTAASPRRLHASLGSSFEILGLGDPAVGNSIWLEGGFGGTIAPSLRLRFTRTHSLTQGAEDREAFFVVNAAALEGCATALRVRAGTQAVELRPCLHVWAGTLEGSSAAAGSVERATRPWISAGALLRVRWVLFEPFSLEVGGGLTVPFVRDRFFFRPGTPIYRTPPVGMLGEVGIGTTFR